MTKEIIAFQGEKGAYSHLACEETFPQAIIKTCSTFEETFKMNKKQKYIQFLNENENFQNWIQSSPFQIVGFSITEELELKVIFRNSAYLFED